MLFMLNVKVDLQERNLYIQPRNTNVEIHFNCAQNFFDLIEGHTKSDKQINVLTLFKMLIHNQPRHYE